ncbi:uncharacterized protein [Henckelia pumila]|uniref:uncharacterized protein n=1 Tax=Henckelia pumila TaxID=405737 RepID=UPI003C6DCCB0
MSKLFSDIISFNQNEGESLHAACTKFKKMMRMCIQHNLTQRQQTQTLYNGADQSIRSMLDVAANGSLFRKTPAEAWEIIGNMAERNIGWPDVKKNKKAGVLEVDALTALNAKIDALTHQMTIMQTTPANQVQVQQPKEQQVFEMDAANFMGNQGRQPFNPYSNTYNPGWKSHPNLSWKFTDPAANTSKPVEKKPSFGEIMMKYVAGTETHLQNQEAMFQKLETKMSHIATQLSTRPAGSLPSNTEKNPRDVNVILVVTRSQAETAEKRIEDEEAKELVVEKAIEEAPKHAESAPTGKKGIGEVNPTTISLQLADRSIKYARGIVEDVLVKVVPKKGGINVIANENNELIPTRTVSGWRRCEESNRVLKWEKCHFMVREGIVLEHKVSEKGVEVDQAKLEAFQILKQKLKPAAVIVAPDWSLPFELMCDASDIALGSVLGKKRDKEFGLEIVGRKGSENQVADHLSRLENQRTETQVIHDEFPDEQLFEDPFLFKICADGIIRRCIPAEEESSIPSHCHTSPTGGHFDAGRTAAKVLQSGFYWSSLFKDAYAYVIACDACQRIGNISRRHEMPLNDIFVCKVFDVWGIDFMGPFSVSEENKYIFDSGRLCVQMG